MVNGQENFFSYDEAKKLLSCYGDWNLLNLKQIQESFATLSLSQLLCIDGKNLATLDSAGAWFLLSLPSAKQNVQVTFQQFTAEHQELLTLVKNNSDTQLPPPSAPLTTLEQIGIWSIIQYKEFIQYLSFVGKLTFEFLRLWLSPSHWRINQVLGVIYRTGFQALPIIALLSFMIGVVISYQMALQLKTYGASIYIVDLLGLSILREFGPLLTAIMVAGRTGSAFTAELGMMKLNQEIDALDTIGVTSSELLLLPRIIGLFIALPLLTMWANIFGILGGMMMAHNILNIPWRDFLERFPTVIPLKTLIIGMGKAPIFALIIGSIGCFEGMSVKDSAESVGTNTTRSVVLSIFFIILADAVFSVILSELKL